MRCSFVTIQNVDVEALAIVGFMFLQGSHDINVQGVRLVLMC